MGIIIRKFQVISSSCILPFCFQCLNIPLRTLANNSFCQFREQNQLILVLNKYNQTLLHEIFFYYKNLQPHHRKSLFWFSEFLTADGFAIKSFFILLLTLFQISLYFFNISSSQSKIHQLQFYYHKFLDKRSFLVELQ